MFSLPCLLLALWSHCCVSECSCDFFECEVGVPKRALCEVEYQKEPRTQKIRTNTAHLQSSAIIAPMTITVRKANYSSHIFIASTQAFSHCCHNFLVGFFQPFRSISTRDRSRMCSIQPGMEPEKPMRASMFENRGSVQVGSLTNISGSVSSGLGRSSYALNWSSLKPATYAGHI